MYYSKPKSNQIKSNIYLRTSIGTIASTIFGSFNDTEFLSTVVGKDIVFVGSFPKGTQGRHVDGIGRGLTTTTAAAITKYSNSNIYQQMIQKVKRGEYKKNKCDDVHNDKNTIYFILVVLRFIVPERRLP